MPLSKENASRKIKTYEIHNKNKEGNIIDRISFHPEEALLVSKAMMDTAKEMMEN